MYQLQLAEHLDSFFYKVNENPINRKAREHLSYLPVNNYTEKWLGNTEIVTMNPTAEAGMPHTRPPNVICMPHYFPESKRDETLAHEYVHIHQRRNVDTWNRYFQKDGWSRIDPLELPERLVSRCRMNPDTIDQPFWRWKDRFVPLPLYEREDKPQLRQVVVHWYDMESGVRQPEAPRSFLELYGSAPQSEHPREVTAVEIAKIFKSTADVDEYLRR
jgi:hypothetical protein